MKKFLFMAALALGVSCFNAEANNSKKLDDVTRGNQVKDLEFGMFLCWSFSSFSGYEWTPGVDDISFFNPTGCDTDQWCKVAKDAGMKYILFLTKHHDGFCLWDTKTTDRKVSNTPALKGRDVLRELKKSCDKYGLKLALYFSEGDWSWNPKNKKIHKSVSRPDIKKAQLKELLTNYGPIEFLWFDHAISDGGLSHIDTTKWVNKISPNTFCGYNAGATAGRLNLRERGKPGPIGDKSAVAGHVYIKDDYSNFQVAEFTYPILEGQGISGMRGAQWFYSLPENDNNAASPEKIYADYLGAVKYGNIFSLDVGPDRSGKLRKIDVATLKKVGQYIRGEVKLQLPVKIKSIKASSVWDKDFSAEKAIDGKSSTRWGAKEGARSGWLEVQLAEKQVVSGFIVDESKFNRITAFEVQVKEGSGWKTLFKGAKPSDKKQSLSPVKGQSFRLLITEAKDVPTVVEFKLLTN